MIFDINLLKDKVKQSKRKAVLKIILYIELFLFVLTYLILFSYRVNLDYQVKDIQRNLTVLNEDIIFLSGEGTTLSGLKAINKQYADITSELEIIKGLTKDRILFSHKLKGISKVLPDNMWIDKLYLKDGQGEKNEKIKVIYLSGFVMAEKEEAFKSVQSFIKALEQETLFKEGIGGIQLSSISKPRTESSMGITEFEITCNIIKK